MGNVTGWIDIPAIEAIDYFSSILVSFYRWASHYAQFIGLVGLCWSAFKLINSRFTIRDFWWDTFYKWLLFILLMSFYIPITAGIAYIGNKIGIEAGNGKNTIINELKDIKNCIQQDLATEKMWEEELEVTLESKFENLDIPSIETDQSYDSYLDSVYEKIGQTRFDSKAQKNEANKIVEEFRQKNTERNIFSAKTLKAIDNILIEKKLDGTDGDNLTDSYIDLNIWLKGKDDKDTNYLSPAALLRLATLSCQILWEKNQLQLAKDYDEIDNDDINFLKKGFSKLTTTLSYIPQMLMTMLCCISLVICVIFTDIQYLMCIIEYAIVTGIGAFFIPFILFDGTKEMPKKLVPVFTGFLIKMLVMDIIIFFIFHQLISNTIQIINTSTDMNWVYFAGQIFFCFIAFILAANGPKIAMTILTGQPQLSMGEFVQMAGSVAAGAVTVGKTAKTAGHVAKEGARKTAQGAVNTAGEISKLHGAASSASQGVKELGGTKGQQVKAAARGMFATFTGGMKDKIQNAGNNFLHGGGSGKGGGMGGPNGSQAHQRSGQNTSRDLAEGESRTLNNYSNPKFQNATRFDEATQSNVNIRTKEFLQEKHAQGKNIGQEAALKEMEKAEKKQNKRTEKSKLPENLTGGERGK